ncbi:hypothetical protein [Halalkalicoccus sp. NIPERK01]|uniref:hypothetical protein n=1 Tax=Halalkalicoccus sp. NIPERK01 TaxID=3053469 RepID=UPI00256F3EEC|nr:hypothetical protein [Halalkalicoccus sp. NIPERK01]MDL5362019.1 hypothetical protein [Halalkalicoccus sp. NIPERK01]
MTTTSTPASVASRIARSLTTAGGAYWNAITRVPSGSRISTLRSGEGGETSRSLSGTFQAAATNAVSSS